MGYHLFCDVCGEDIDRSEDHTLVVTRSRGGGGQALTLDLCETHMEEVWTDLESYRE